MENPLQDSLEVSLLEFCIGSLRGVLRESSQGPLEESLREFCVGSLGGALKKFSKSSKRECLFSFSESVVQSLANPLEDPLCRGALIGVLKDSFREPLRESLYGILGEPFLRIL